MTPLHRALVATLVVLTLLAPAALAAPRTMSKSYVGSVVTMCARGVQPVDVGSACFALSRDDAGRPATLSMVDAALGGVAAAYWYQRGSQLIEAGGFCGTTETVVPEGATLVIVFSVAPEPASGLPPCPVVSGAGTITVSIH